MAGRLIEYWLDETSQPRRHITNLDKARIISGRGIE